MMIILRLIKVSTVTLITFLLVNVSQAQTVTSEGVIATNFFRGPGLCMDYVKNKNVKVIDCDKDDDESQVWYTTDVKDWRTIHSIALGDEFCLTIDDIGYALMAGCNNSDSQLWKIESPFQGVFHIRNRKYYQVRNKDFCLDNATRDFGAGMNNRMMVNDCGYSGSFWRLSIR